MMEMDLGKLFVGGISWDTDEDRLKEYFGSYGEVIEAVIMRDRATGRARGFGFVVFADAAVAERVVKEKHLIDGRTVEAKKAVPRDDQQLITRNNGSFQGSSPGFGRTKKIFVGGLASSVNESDFKAYFDQFGTITDVVVMYDHVTQRPRGFGFISFDSEDSVERVLHKTFHELNGKMVEVKRAVPKEISPGSSRSPLLSYNYGFSRANNIINSPLLGGYGVRMDGRFSPLSSSRAGFGQIDSPSYGMNIGIEQGLNAGFDSSNYGRTMNPYFGRYNTPIGYNNGRNNRNSWERSDLENSLNNPNSSSSYFGSESGGFGMFGSGGGGWGASASSLTGNSTGYGGEKSGGIDRIGVNTSLSASSAGNLYRSGSIYNDPTWQPSSSELNTSSFGYRFGNFEDGIVKESDEYGMVYDIASRQSSRGIAA